VGVIALIDGEHHPAAVREVLDRLEAERGLTGVLFCGGEEKLPADALSRMPALYGREVETGPAQAALERLAGGGAEAVVDLVDEPALDACARLSLATEALARGLAYEAPGMRVEPPARERVEFAGTTISVVGTGKRTGKTAVAGHLARLLRQAGRRPALVCMGRGGPAEPQLAGPDTGLAELLELARGGGHAASDYLEGAVVAGVPAVGARRVGGGPLSPQPAQTNFVAAAQMAATLPVDALIFEGSGACAPPVHADRTVCVAGPSPSPAARASLGDADLVLSAGAEIGPEAGRRSARFRLVAEPLEPVPAGARVALFTTGAPRAEGVEATVTSGALARREELAADLDRAAAERCDLYLTELKAAAIDMVAERAQAAGARLAFVRNRPVGLDGDLDAELLALA